MGWQTKNKAVVLAAGRILVPLYSDGFSFSLMALTDDQGRTWTHTRHLERDLRGPAATRSHYPSIIQGRDGALHVVYSYHRNDRGRILPKPSNMPDSPRPGSGKRMTGHNTHEEP